MTNSDPLEEDNRENRTEDDGENKTEDDTEEGTDEQEKVHEAVEEDITRPRRKLQPPVWMGTM